LRLTFDAAYDQKWQNNMKVSGDNSTFSLAKNTIIPGVQRTLSADTHKEFCDNPNYRRSLALLGYEDILE
jgi:hypothetical protein